jgi:histone chaperone ASF1
MSAINITNMVSIRITCFRSRENTHIEPPTSYLHSSHFNASTIQNVLDNPTTFLNPIQFEITFECTIPLTQEIEWKVVYVGSAQTSSFDQILDEIEVGPVPTGTHKFILQVDPPDPTLIPEADLVGITVILVTCSYREQEFARVGYYVNNEFRPFEGYDKEQHGEVELESPIDLSKVYRTIVADKPRVTRFPIQWSGPISNSGVDASTHVDGSYGDVRLDAGEAIHENSGMNGHIPLHNHYDESVTAHSDMEMDDDEDDYISLSPLTSPEKTRGHSLTSMMVTPEWGNQNSNGLMVE